ncbi:ABC transporter substrate-binding protein [Austwickia chelonae]|uniref:ABC transporter substrate-binding protein n=1 Tax=Austwickia chelonae TaxID=100225 RepID=UPI000E24902E|nr:ABC transporter substrate-binding protein [Austwickia chelonae]
MKQAVRTTLIAASTTLALTTLAGCGSANTTASDTGNTARVEITNCGYTVSVDGPRKKAVTAEQGSTELLLALGLENQMAGTSNIKTEVAPQWKEAYQKVKVVTPQILTPELTLSVSPDIVVSPLRSQFSKDRVGTRDELKTKGIASYISEADCAPDKRTIKDPIEAIFTDYRNIGKLFGVSGKADELVAEQTKQIEEIEKNRAGGNPQKLVWIYSTFKGQPYVAGGGGFPEAMSRRVGATNVFSDIKDSWPEVSWEKVAESDPDIIVVADLKERGKPGDTAEEKIKEIKENPAMAKTRAVQANSFLVVPGVELDASPRFVNALKIVAAEVNKKAS